LLDFGYLNKTPKCPSGGIYAWIPNETQAHIISQPWDVNSMLLRSQRLKKKKSLRKLKRKSKDGGY